MQLIMLFKVTKGEGHKWLGELKLKIGAVYNLGLVGN